MTDPDRIYRDEPIPLRRMREEREEAPEKIRELKRMMEPLDGLFLERAEAFYRQAEFMRDYEDHYEFDGPFFHYYPTYQDMNTREMRGYFSWRTAARKGDYRNAPLSFIFVYVYEILNGIGPVDPEDGFQILTELLEAYQEKEPSLQKYLTMWMKDYIVYWGLGAQYEEQWFQEEKILDQKLNVLEHYREYPEEDVFEAVQALSAHRIDRSPAFRKAPEDIAAVTARVYAAASEYSESHHYGSLLERSFGRRDPMNYRMFRASVFFDTKKHADRVREIDPVRRYVCREGRWTCSRYDIRTDRPRSSFLGEFLQETDRQMRDVLGIKPALTEKFYRKAFKKIITQTIDTYFREKEEEKKTVIRIDRSALSGIREDASVTRDRLLSEEEKAEMSEIRSAPTTEKLVPGEPHILRPTEEPESGEIHLLPPQPEEDPFGFTKEEASLLHLLLEGGDVRKFAGEHSLMLSVLVDSVNEKLYDDIGDTLLEMPGELPEIVPDYLEDLQRILEEYGI